MRRRNLLIIATLFCLVLSVWAGDMEKLTELMKTKVATITGILENQAMAKEKKNEKIEAATNAMFDYRLMARLSLGKDDWSKLDKAKQEEYMGLFERRIKDSYLEKLHLYTDEKVVVEAAKEGEKGRIHVPSFIMAKDGKTEMLYKFYKAKSGEWLIYDVEIAGVSIVQTYRAQFAEILKTKNVFELLDMLKSQEQL